MAPGGQETVGTSDSAWGAGGGVAAALLGDAGEAGGDGTEADTADWEDWRPGAGACGGVATSDPAAMALCCCWLLGDSAAPAADGEGPGPAAAAAVGMSCATAGCSTSLTVRWPSSQSCGGRGRGSGTWGGGEGGKVEACVCHTHTYTAHTAHAAPCTAPHCTAHSTHRQHAGADGRRVGCRRAVVGVGEPGRGDGEVGGLRHGAGAALHQEAQALQRRLTQHRRPRPRPVQGRRLGHTATAGCRSEAAAVVVPAVARGSAPQHNKTPYRTHHEPSTAATVTYTGGRGHTHTHTLNRCHAQ